MNKPLRILFVTKSPPYPHTIGGNQRSALIYRALAQHGSVDLVLAIRRSELPDSHIDILERDYNLKACSPLCPPGKRGLWRLIRPLHPSFVDRLAQHAGSVKASYKQDPFLSAQVEEIWRTGKYDLFVGRSLSVFKQAGGDVLHPNALDVDDMATDVYRSRLSSPQSSLLESIVARYHLVQARRSLKKAFACCDLAWLAKEEDRRETGPTRVRVLPNVPWENDGPVQPAASAGEAEDPEIPGGKERCGREGPAALNQTVLIVASFYHKPNVEGMDHFLRHCWPEIRQAVPGGRLRVGGTGIENRRAVSWGAHPGVEVLGFVKDLDKEYAACAFTIEPVYWGGGTNIKVLESLAHGRTCVVTRFGQRGYEDVLRHGDSLWVAETDQEMVEGCIRLLTDTDRREGLARQGRRLVEKHFSRQKFFDVVAESITVLTGRGGVGSGCKQSSGGTRP